MDERHQERIRAQRAARDKQLDDIDQALDRASVMIRNSQTEIQRSRDLMRDRREQDRRQDQAEDLSGE